MTTPECGCPESMRLYRDTTGRDARGRLLSSTRVVSCQRCGRIHADTTKTWQPSQSTTNATEGITQP